MKYLIVVISFAVLVSAEIFDRPCRTSTELGVKTNFNPQAYLGVWYEIERYEQVFQAGGDCVTARYTLNPNGTINVINQAFFIENGTRIEFEGLARISFPDETPLRAMLNVTFFENQPNLSNYWVLSTDYANYAFVVSCMDLPENRSLESFWLLSRASRLPAAARERADQLVSQFLDINRIRKTEQDSIKCRRTSEE